MIRISKVAFDDQTIELAIPVNLSDDETQFMVKTYDCERTSVVADAFSMFNTVQKQIAQLMANKEDEKE